MTTRNDCRRPFLPELFENSVGRPKEAVIVDTEAPLPELPKLAEARFAEAERRCKNPILLRDMRLRLAGYTQRQVEALHPEVTNKDGVVEALRRYGLLEIARQLTSERLIDNHREIALTTTEMQLENLTGAEPKADTRLAIVGGISTDKVATAERWTTRGETGENLGDRLAEIAERIVKAGGKLDLKISGPGGEAKIEAGE